MRLLRLVWDCNRDAPPKSPAASVGEALLAATNERRRCIMTVFEFLDETRTEHYAGDPEDDENEEEKRKHQDDDHEEDDEEEEEDDGLIVKK